MCYSPLPSFLLSVCNWSEVILPFELVYLMFIHSHLIRLHNWVISIRNRSILHTRMHLNSLEWSSPILERAKMAIYLHIVRWVWPSFSQQNLKLLYESWLVCEICHLLNGRSIRIAQVNWNLIEWFHIDVVFDCDLLSKHLFWVHKMHHLQDSLYIVYQIMLFLTISLLLPKSINHLYTFLV